MSVVADKHAIEAEVGYKILRGLEAENTNSDVCLDHFPLDFPLLPLTISTTSVAGTRSRLLCVCPQRSGSVSLLPQSSLQSCQRAEPPKPGGLASLKRAWPCLYVFCSYVCTVTFLERWTTSVLQ
jgi:hypothetical protein